MNDDGDTLITAKLVSTSQAELLEEPVSLQATFEGTVVNVARERSGIINRCPEEDCTRVLNDQNECPVHGPIDQPPELDMRVIATLDNGTETMRVVFDAEMTEALTGTSFEDAKERLEGMMGDRNLLAGDLLRDAIGQKVTVTGRTYEYNGRKQLNANELERPDAVSLGDVEQALIQARSPA